MSRVRRRLVDWRFWTALAGCLLVVWLVVSTAQAFKAKDRQIDALIQAAREGDQTAAQGRVQASRERDRLLAQQGRLVRLYRDLSARQDALLAYLRRQGITLPENLEPVSPSTNKNSGRGTGPARPGTVPTEQKPGPGPPPRPEPGPPGGGPPPPPGGPPSPPPPVQDLLDQLEGLLP